MWNRDGNALLLGHFDQRKELRETSLAVDHQRSSSCLAASNSALRPDSAMNVTSPVASEVTSVEFNFLTKAEVLAVSVKQIVNPVTFASTLPGKTPVPLPGGLYDPALGASDSLRQR